MVPPMVRGHLTTRIQNSALVSNKNEEECVNYGTVYPQNDRVNEDCEVTINKMDVHDFVNKMRAQKYKISLLKINLNVSEDIKLKVNQTRCTISPFEWIWTYKGQNGGFQYLSLMKEFSYYSLSLLDHYTLSMNFNLNLKGNCYLKIGDRNTTERLGLAFLQVFNQSFQHVKDMGLPYGYICYLSRTYMENIIYMFSKYIISPKQSMGYRCCRNAFNKTTREDTISCTSDTIMIDSGLWWNFPYVMGWLLFLFVPLLILQCSENKYKNVTVGHGKWLLSNPVSFGTVLRNPFNRAYSSGNICSRLLKIICILLTSLFVIMEVLSYYYFMNNFVVSSTKAEVPFNWITMAAGYSLSKESFLPCFGGPYIALGLYYISSALLLCLPTDLRLSKMSTLTQSITALFICLIPKLWHMFEEKGEKNKEETKIAEIKNIIEQYCRCYIHKRAPTNIQDDSSIVDEMEQYTSSNTSSDDELLQHLLLDVDIE
ncbi:unnamed protein product [Mytilus coruscus]|uniref:Uncharacterized protein n=1 Tax=Mytilus coruscus TaxID=42192 RepID=A0A6J8DEM2_MYTCO|nr:unnamed protein product [Mytilus coruscus]